MSHLHLPPPPPPTPPSPHLPPADLGENMCRVSKRPALNYMRSCNHKVPTVYTSEVSKWKGSKINLKIIFKAHALLQAWEKTCAKFQKDRFKIVWGIAITRYPLSIHLKSENDKVQKVQKNDQKVWQGLYEKHMHIFRLWRKHV